MSKKVKLEVILTIDKEINIDESMIQRSVGLLGEVDSYNLSENIESTTPSQHNQVVLMLQIIQFQEFQN